MAEFYTLNKVCKESGIGIDTLKKAIKSKKLRTVTIDGVMYVSKDNFDFYMKKKLLYIRRGK